jgi:eukaryotic-like serine/threonine-protein kinase
MKQRSRKSAAPQKIGKYPVLGEIGRGESAVVYLGEDPFNDRKVAIKMADASGAHDAEAAKRFEHLFLNEASLAGRLQHPNIIAVFDAVIEGAQRYIVMEYVPGGSLRQFCHEGNLLPVRQIAMMMFKCCRALDYAQQHGVTHRDVKPDNILMGEEIKISDFGAARIAGGTHEQVDGFVGSPAYMAPEVINEYPVTIQGDIYSLGVVMYQLLTGRLPYIADNSVAMIQKILAEHPIPLQEVRPEIPESLVVIVSRAMDKKLSDRYSSWFDMARDLIESFPQLEALGREISASEKLSKLRGLPFFSAFKEAELAEVVRAAGWERRNRDTPLLDHGEWGQTFCIVASGQAKVMRDGRFIGTLQAGDCFGETALFEEASLPRTMATAISEVEVVRLHASQLEQLSEGCQLRFNKQFLQSLVGRLSQAHDSAERSDA